MNILTPENKTVDINLLPDMVEDDLKYSVLNLNDKHNYDFYFESLVYLESFYAPAVVLKIDDNLVNMPCLESPHDWKILIGDAEYGQVELVSLEDLNSRNFKALVFNPISSFKPMFKDISIVDTYTELKWFFPNMQQNMLLTTPIEKKDKPDCVFFINGSISKKVDSIEISSII